MLESSESIDHESSSRTTAGLCRVIVVPTEANDHILVLRFLMNPEFFPLILVDQPLAAHQPPHTLLNQTTPSPSTQVPPIRSHTLAAYDPVRMVGLQLRQTERRLLT